MPRTRGLNRASVSAPVAPANVTGVRSFFSSASASWAATWRAASVSGDGFGERPPLQPLATSASTTSTDALRTAISCHRGGGLMRIYAQRRGQLAGQLAGDLAVLVWTVVWAAVGIAVDAAVAALAGPARETSRTARDLAGQLGDAAASAAQVPGLGEQLRRPFDAASGSLGDLVATADRQAASIERLAAVMGWLVFLIPVTTVL